MIFTKAKAYEKHGLRKTVEYNSWWGMKERCYDPTRASYENYGGRGIKVCDRWHTSFSNFIEDMGKRPDGYSLDRIDNDGDYEPSNCRWSPKYVQQVNQRIRSDNKSGVKGVCFDKRRNKWEVKVSSKYIGRYETLEQAKVARLQAFKLIYPELKEVA